MTSGAPTTAGEVTTWLDGEVAAGRLKGDPAQRQAALCFDRLLGKLSAPPPRRLFGLIAGKPAAAPRGLYLWGGVGRGKTLLMDRFFLAAPVARKRRQHFHAFMAEMHEAIAAARKAMAAGDGRDPVEIVARGLAAEISLLCFDEFAVTDIADAMLLGRLFGKLLDLGLVLVATSNVAPDRLYWNGLSRQSFLPFIELLKTRCRSVHLAEGTDHRLGGLKAADLYLTPLGPATSAAADRLWAELSSGGEAAAEIAVKGRVLNVARAAGRRARMSFAEACEQPLAASDYRALARHFDLLMLTDVPRLRAEQRNAARRLIMLVDVFYDAGHQLMLTADAEPDDLYRASAGNEAFEFARTASRLVEMRSEAWRQQRAGNHGPHDARVTHPLKKTTAEDVASS